jgi:hypothetical protein
MDSSEQVKFLVDFANRDLQMQREGYWIDLQDDLSKFFPLGPQKLSAGVILFDPRQDPEWNSFLEKKYPKKKIVDLQAELKALLRTKSKQAVVDDKGKMTVTTPVDVKLSYVYFSGDSLWAIGKFRDLFLQRVINLLSDTKRDPVPLASMIRQCEPCGKFFFRVRRQIHCSPQCADRANYLKRTKGSGEQQKAQSKSKRRKK